MNNGVVYVQSEYPKYTPMLAKILEGLLSGASDHDKYTHYQEASKRIFTYVSFKSCNLYCFA